MPSRDRTDEPDLERVADFEDRLRAGAYSIGVCAAGGVIGYFSSTDIWEEMPIEVGPDRSLSGNRGVRCRWVVARF